MAAKTSDFVEIAKAIPPQSSAFSPKILQFRYESYYATSLMNKNTKIYVAMSGGVDSSVAAALLKKQGYYVVGVFFKPWSPNNATSYCSWEQDRLDAMQVAVRLGIEFKTWDFSKEYGSRVAKYMIEGYRTGITPNPDVMCNKEIKFGLFLKKALLEGADYIATGHYVRLLANNESVRINEYTKNKPQKPISKFVNSRQIRYSLMMGVDSNKDQSYFLWTLTQEQLKHCLFPIGDYTKPEIRKLAKKFNLSNYAKKDSQGVCFVGQLDFKKFLTTYIKPKVGSIILLDDNLAQSTRSARSGRVVGQHDGAYYYTIGQRHGLDIKDGNGPYYVIDKDIKKNLIYITNYSKSINKKEGIAKLEKVNWINDKIKIPANCQVKIRYRSKSIPVSISKLNLETEEFQVKFKKKFAIAVAPGQSAVFYRGSELLGGGIII